MKKVDNLFIVDDDEAYRFLAKEIIGETDLVNQIKVFYNGKEAIDFLKTAHYNPDNLPEVILLDLNMPIMDGWEFLSEYTALKPRIGKKITIYIVSSSIDPRDIERAKSISDVTDFIIKPISKEHFVEVVKNLQG
ncbi:MAG: response regulator [Bacteroidota bacterium]